MFSRFFRITLSLLFLSVALVAPRSTHAIATGCCVLLMPNRTDAATEADVSACFPLQTNADCDAYKNSKQVPAVWREQGCAGLPVCANKAPTGCCNKSIDAITESCFPVPDKDACDLFASHSKSSAKVGKEVPISIDFTLSAGACTTVSACEGKITDAGLYPEQATETTSKESSVPIAAPIIPTLTYEIPGLQPFTGPGGSFKEGYIIPYIGQYIAGIYAFATGAVVTLAIAMIIFAGIKWQTAGGDTSRVSSAKTTMTNAVVGLLLAFGTYLILYTLNPALVEFKGLQISTVKGSTFVKEISAAQCTKLTGAAVKSAKDLETLARSLAEQTGIPELPCMVIASMRNESGGRQCAIGHDENATSKDFSVEARQKFISSGTYGSGKTFPAVACHDRSCQTSGPINDDEFNPDAPPDYGLDWHYSHGFGPGQSTIFPNSLPCSGKESQGRGFRVVGGGCYSIPELLSSETAIEIMVKHFKSVWAGDPRKAFVAYAGKIEPNNPIIEARMKAYEACQNGK